MNITIRFIYNDKGQDTGAILHAHFNAPTSIQQKYILENKLMSYAFDKLYPGEVLSIYRDMYTDSPSITVIKNINRLNEEVINID
jgi:hypothetical protein